MGIIILYNWVYECLSTMYTDYSNNFDTSHVAYPEGQTFEEMQAEWAIFAVLQPALEDLITTNTNRNTSTLIDLHTYPIKYIPPYIFTSNSLNSKIYLPSNFAYTSHLDLRASNFEGK